jgi:GntR family transcriptional regulator / MocR family aminotransferase
MFLKLDTQGPLYEQIYRELRTQILKGQLTAGFRAPATRELANDLRVSRNVVMIAYQQLVAEGYLTARRGAGTFVANELPQRLTTAPSVRAPGTRQPSLPIRLSGYARRIADESAAATLSFTPRRTALPYDFRYGRPSFTDFPHAAWCRILARRARRSSLRDLDYGPPEGLPALREVIAEYVGRARAVRCSPDQVLVIGGSQQALDLAARVLIDPGEVVLMEEPHYLGARMAMKAAGARVEPIAVDAYGLRTSELAQGRRAARLVIVTPSHQFPTGAVMPLARRLELLRWANRSGACIFEDDYDSEYRYAGRPIEALQALDDRGCVLYAATFSKLMFPSLRLGYLVLPESLVGPFRSAKAVMDTGCPTLSQLALVDFMREGHFERHLHRLRTRNASRRAALLDAIDRYLGKHAQVSGVNAGLHVLMWLPEVPSDRTGELRRRAESAGVGVYPVSPFYLAPPTQAGLILGYASLPEKQIAEGIRRLASALSEYWPK